jgi:hypothetical protein
MNLSPNNPTGPPARVVPDQWIPQISNSSQTTVPKVLSWVKHWLVRHVFEFQEETNAA